MEGSFPPPPLPPFPGATPRGSKRGFSRQGTRY
ncbi:hypothetical protein TNMX_04385 [Thermus sp. NMX2.A1]|nr:hypothetical protein TNMX_04385 [Thermus sp. NMX2.A1]